MEDRNLKRAPPPDQSSGSLNEPGWKLMRRMGYTGEGLGLNAQGIKEPVSASTQKGRRGLGSSTLVGASDIPVDPKLVWCEGHQLDCLSDDRMWHWSLMDERSPNSGVTEKEELQQILLAPDDERALGPEIRDIEQESHYCSAHLLTQLTMYKNKLDLLSELSVRESHQRSNPYESLKNGIFMNRAAMKLANMDALFDGIFTNIVDKSEILYFADVCAGPGGFSEYLLWRRCNASALCPANSVPIADDQSDPVVPSSKHHFSLNVKGYGLTLSGSCDFREQDFFAGPPEAFMAHYGPGGDGDITNQSNLASFSSLIGRDTKGKGVHVVCADGGFDVSGENNLQEVRSKQIYLCQCLCALILLRPGGHFVTKLFDTFTEFSVDLIYLMGQVFEEIFIVKPVTSRPANSERYLLCKNLLSPADGMAGCPTAAPTKTNRENNNNKDSSNSMPKQKHRQLMISSSVPQSENKYSPLGSDKTGPVGELIQHFLRVNTALGKGQPAKESAVQADGIHQTEDVLRLCVPGTVSNATSFRDFIVKANHGIAESQCVALSKLIAFSANPCLNDPRQSEQEQSCLRKWQLSTLKRERIPWPLSPSRLPGVIQSLLLDEGKMRLLSDDYNPIKRTTTPCDIYSLSEVVHQADSYVCLVCAAPSITANSQSTSEPMMIYSRGFKDLLFATDEGQWRTVLEVTRYPTPRLPAGTLIWGQFVNEYPKPTLRRAALMVFDVVCIYGYDCRDLPYVERMKLVQRMADVVNFPGMGAGYVRVPPMIRLSELQSFVNGLQQIRCKDTNSPAPTHVYPDGSLFHPRTLLLVKHLSDNWVSAVSRTHGKVYYFNLHTNASTFDLQSTQPPTFTHTRFLRIPWRKDDKKDGIDVAQLITLITSQHNHSN